ncbi:MAG: hypothetical protein A2X25_12785 [Chloroflexi bacterium GWB2_49_20]|nr:MAG: hypothetical protein A2X25_12785 [Chloroflexi bacterium GWB2_49_20]OGN78406.1 MAG: hypothetical protein A2X26_01415 [Chloroflexi bacterium GWC2_49_37]OGN84131.1 MAG: hypothetical protein A2X27_14270 [Chloroflexi bacterium GWD2_49_16]HBG75220.1 hypothetical protein [Anaerolineae bacterium]HCC79145.1 hypothetical protein [Anaerolineae bacterium]
MINRIRIILEQPEYSALIQLSAQEIRTPADQVVVIVRDELIRCGLLPADKLSFGPDLISVAEVAHPPEELCEIADLLSAYGRKIRLTIKAMDEKHRQINCIKKNTEVNDLPNSMEKEEQRIG